MIVRSISLQRPWSVGILLAIFAIMGWAPSRSLAGEEGTQAGWKSLFNGLNLEGWEAIGSAIWKVEDGAIVGTQDGDPSRSGLLVTQQLFQDFELEIDFLIDEHGKYNSGIYLRNDPGTAGRTGYQVNIGRGASGEYCGLYLQEWLSKGDEKDEIRRPLEWNQYRILADAGHIVVFLNGTKIVDYQDPNPSAKLLQKGVIGLQTYGAEGHAGWVKFRNIRIRELAPTHEKTSGNETDKYSLPHE